jgi:four helix bundle protein
MMNDKTMTKSENRNASVDDSFWADGDRVVREEPDIKRVYDLEERTARFGEAIIDCANVIPQNPLTNRIITRFVGAGTSVGANYVEANDAVSKKDFLKSIGMCRKEAHETKHFLRMTARAVPELKSKAREPLDGSERIASNLLQDLEEQVRATDVVSTSRFAPSLGASASSFVIPSCFVIRISSL